MERTEFQQMMAEMKEKRERRRYEALRKKYAVAPDFTNMSLREELEVRNDLDDLEQFNKKYGFGRAGAIDKALTASANVPPVQQPAQYGDVSQTQTVGSVVDILNVKNNTQALLNMLQGYKYLSPLRVNDKYKHSVVSCLGAQGGLSSAVATTGMGVAKEIYDIATKFPNSQEYGGYGAIIKDSINDLLADGQGIVSGYDNPTANCYRMMQSFYPVNIK